MAIVGEANENEMLGAVGCQLTERRWIGAQLNVWTKMLVNCRLQSIFEKFNFRNCQVK